MSSLTELHLDRQRAESFGSAAEDYDRYRPTFPDALIDDLAALGATDALDVGCGTGRVARLLAGQGLTVLGVELDARMATVAREPVMKALDSAYNQHAPEVYVYGRAPNVPARDVASALALLQAAIRAAIDSFGETIPVRIETTATFARRDDSGQA